MKSSLRIVCFVTTLLWFVPATHADSLEVQIQGIMIASTIADPFDLDGAKIVLSYTYDPDAAPDELIVVGSHLEGRYSAFTAKMAFLERPNFAPDVVLDLTGGLLNSVNWFPPDMPRESVVIGQIVKVAVHR